MSIVLRYDGYWRIIDTTAPQDEQELGSFESLEEAVTCAYREHGAVLSIPLIPS